MHTEIPLGRRNIYLKCCVKKGFVEVLEVLKCGDRKRVLARVKLCRAIPSLGSYCRLCAHPVPPSGRCRAHCSDREFVDATIAVGMYYTTDVREELAARGVRMGNVLTSLILELKSRRRAAPWLGLAMATVLRERVFGIGVEDVDVVTFVPKHNSELKVDSETGERYNQAELLARVVSEVIGKPLIDLVVKKVPLSLSGRSAEDRYRLCEDAYDIRSERINEIHGKRVLLVDDVRTSGATANTIARKLKSVGASRVYLLVAGRATFKPQFLEFVESLRKRI